uniref:Uncharacterized protein n=1 Tax=Cacopsylla melanoneura TaxID=428564 RepID=A0A8D9F2G0_9HEMI
MRDDFFSFSKSFLHQLSMKVSRVHNLINRIRYEHNATPTSLPIHSFVCSCVHEEYLLKINPTFLPIHSFVCTCVRDEYSKLTLHLSLFTPLCAVVYTRSTQH